MPLILNGTEYALVFQGGFFATLEVTTNTDTVVTVGGETKTTASGNVIFSVYYPGTYTVICEKNGTIKQKTIEISSVSAYSLTLYVESLIPDAYQELTYIQSTGSCFIDTGYQFTSNVAKISLDVTLTQGCGGKNIFGSATNNDANWFGIYMQGDFHGGLYCGNANPYGFDFVRNVRKSLSFSRNNTVLTIVNDDQSLTTSVDGTIVCGNNVMIASQPPLGASRSPNGVRYHNFLIEEGGEAKRNYLPVKRKSDNVSGMYDTVTKSFYQPLGTFIAGDEV